MPRTRLLKHDFFLKEKDSKLTPRARLLLMGLWTLADRDGRLKDEPSKIRVQIFPYEKVNIEELLNELNGMGAILRYALYIQVVDWADQRPHFTETVSKIPAPAPELLAATEISVGLLRTQYTTAAVAVAVTCSDTVDIVHPQPTASDGTVDRTFQAFWDQYPKKQNRKTAFRLWCRLSPTGQLLDDINSGLVRAIGSHQWQDPQFVPLPSTWLNGRRWEDQELGPSAPPKPTDPREGKCCNIDHPGEPNCPPYAKKRIPRPA